MTNNPEMTHAVQAYRPIEALIPAHWQEGTTLAQDGTSLHYWRTGGDHPALVVLHGFQSAGLTWLRAAKALEAAYDVVMLDFRAHGKSGGPDKGFSLDLLTTDTATLIRALMLEKPFVLGHSMGGEVAGRLAADFPEIVRGVILVDPPARVFAMPKDAEASPWMQQWLASMQALKTQSHAERMVSGTRMLPPSASGWTEEDFVPFIDAQAQINLDVLAYASTMDYGLVTSGRIARIECPILVLTGDPQRGSVLDAEAREAFETAWRDGEWVQIDGAGHFVQVDAFPTFIAAIQRFLGAH